MIIIGEIFGWIAFITSTIGLIPQIYKSFKTKSTGDLSMVMLINYLICSCSWIVYGILESSKFVIWSNIVCALSSSVSIFQKVYYEKFTKFKKL